MSTRQLNPTLWRTCRVLSGRIRLKLLRQLYDNPGRSVTELAAAVGIGVSDASQELRRLQSRGLLKADRQGALLIYRMESDPQVPSAAPLLAALNTALSTCPPAQDEQMIPLATGLAHPRRIAVAKHLTASAQSTLSLRTATRIPVCPLSRHLKTLKVGGWIEGNKQSLRFAIPAHPLARALADLIQKET